MSSRNRRSWPWWIALSGLAMGVALGAQAQDVVPSGGEAIADPTVAPGDQVAADPAAAAAPAGDEVAAPAADAPTGPGADGPEQVYVGVYMHHVPELDLHSNSYLADFYLWFRWNGELDPTQTFEFTNLVDGWDVMRIPIYTNDEGEAEPDLLPDGARYQVFHVQGRFGHPFDVRDYPFDSQHIVILIEEAEHTPEELVYVVDSGTEEVHDEIDIPGWEIGTVHAAVREVVYDTNFGDTRRAAGADRYTQMRYSLRVSRPVWGNLVMTVLPVAIVMMITFIMFGIESKYFEGRLGLGITSLISAVALQLTAAGDLPSTGYLVLLDHIYNISYVVIFLSLLESVVAVRLYDAGKTDTSYKLDILSLVSLTIFFFGGIAVVILLR